MDSNRLNGFKTGQGLLVLTNLSHANSTTLAAQLLLLKLFHTKSRDI